jgi:hypothetical protein
MAGSDGASESTSAATSTTTTSGPSSTTTTTTTAPDPDTTDSGSSGEPGAACPPASPDIGAVTQIVRAETWTFADDSGISEGVCSATDYDGAQLVLECTRVGEGPEVHTIAIVGGGPVVGGALAAMVGMDELQLFLPYGMGFFPGGWLLWHFSLRSASGDLLVLGSYDWTGPGSSFAPVGVDGWTDPFTELELVDPDCALVYNSRPDTWPENWKPFALELGTDDGSVSLFEGQQQSVTAGGSAYEVSVTSARMDIPCGADCPESEIQFSIVRRL